MKEKGDRMRRMFLFEQRIIPLCTPSALSTWWRSDFNEAFVLCHGEDTGRRERERNVNFLYDGGLLVILAVYVITGLLHGRFV